MKILVAYEEWSAVSKTFSHSKIENLFQKVVTILFKENRSVIFRPHIMDIIEENHNLFFFQILPNLIPISSTSPMVT